MALIVQKYGGTSVANSERINAVADRVAEGYRRGDQLVVVLSAMAGVTNNLISLAKEVTSQPSEREMDMLLATGEQTTIALAAMALHERGVPAVSLTGAQAGIVTDGIHSKAKISNITPDEVRKHLDDGKVVIVAGFQGRTLEGQITTFGRGGSDLTGIALAAVLKADLCQICTDVDGVYTADPRVVKTAHKMDEISYEEMLEMASSGSKVMQSRAVEFANKFDVVFEVRSSFNSNLGTIVKKETSSMEDVVVRGVSLERKQAKVTITGVPDTPGAAAGLFVKIADSNINVDMIVQNVSHPDQGGTGFTDLTFTLPEDDLVKVEPIVDEFVKDSGAQGKELNKGIAKLSVVGIGMRSHSGVAANLFSALSEKSINIQMISTSEIKISIVINEDEAEDAMRAAHTRFGLDQE